MNENIIRNNVISKKDCWRHSPNRNDINCENNKKHAYSDLVKSKQTYEEKIHIFEKMGLHLQNSRTLLNEKLSDVNAAKNIKITLDNNFNTLKKEEAKISSIIFSSKEELAINLSQLEENTNSSTHAKNMEEKYVDIQSFVEEVLNQETENRKNIEITFDDSVNDSYDNIDIAQDIKHDAISDHYYDL